MAVEILKDTATGKSCMFCNTTMWAFGSIFYANEDADKFMEWLGFDPRSLDDKSLDEKINQWRKENGNG